MAPTWTAVSAFPAAFTTWFQDHFAFRGRLVQWQAAFRLLVFRVSPAPAVIRGRDGWRFYADDGATADYLNASPAQLEVDFDDSPLGRYRRLAWLPIATDLVYGLVNLRSDGQRMLCATMKEGSSDFELQVFDAGVDAA